MSTVRADAGELRLGVVGPGRWPAGAGLTLDGQLGLTDLVSAEVSLGAIVRKGDPFGLGTARLTAALDVVSWVPELSIGVGVSAGEGRALLRLVVGGRLRRVVSPTWSWSFGGEGERRDDEWSGIGLLGLWWQYGG